MPYDSSHLTLNIIRELNSDYNISDVSHRFLMYGIRDADTDDKYGKLENELSISLNYIESEKALSSYLKDKSNYTILIHGDMFPCIKQSVRTNSSVSWICWGYIPPKGHKFLLSNISFFLRKKVYRKLRNVVCLLSSDKKEFARIYNLTNIMVLPYWGPKGYDVLDKYSIEKHNHKPLNVYLGNSGYNYQSYMDILVKLAKYKGLIKVHVMFQYPDWPDEKELVRKKGLEIFGDDFVLDETMMDIDTYRYYMAQCDVYICGDQSQTGLGAIHLSLYIGTKVFITGNNLDWEKELGSIVFDVDNINNMNFNSFSRELLFDEKEHNKNVVIKLWDQKDNWIDFLLNKC